MANVQNDLKNELNKKLSNESSKMASRPIELRKQNRPIEHQNQMLNRPIEKNENLSRSPELRDTNQSTSGVRNQNLSRPRDGRSRPTIVHQNQNLNQPTDVRDDQPNLNRSVSIDSDHSNASDIPPETTLFEQIALKVHRYKGNFIYLQRLPGILNLLEIFLGFLTFTLILIACNNYYDPWQGLVISGFAGGKVEVFFFLTCTYALITTSIFTILILISNSYEKSLNAGNFNFIISFALFAFLMFSSVLLLIELSNRNTGILEFEHRFGVKVTCAVFGILNSLFYLLSSSIVFKILSSHERPKHTVPQPI